MRPAPVAARVAVALGSVLLAATAGCSSSPSSTAAAPGTSSPAAPPTTTAPRPSAAGPSTIYANDPAKTVSAQVGETVALRVDVDPAAAETWEVVSYDQAKLFDMGAAYDQTASTILGHSVTQNLLFRATAAGTSKVVLRYGQPGSASASDTTVTFTVTTT